LLGAGALTPSPPFLAGHASIAIASSWCSSSSLAYCLCSTEAEGVGLSVIVAPLAATGIIRPITRMDSAHPAHRTQSALWTREIRANIRHPPEVRRRRSFAERDRVSRLRAVRELAILLHRVDFGAPAQVSRG